MNLDKKALAGFISEIEASRDRQKGETEFQRDVFKRAREKHFDVKAMRIVLQRRAMEPSKREEQDYNVEAYEMALGAKKLAVEAMEQGASAREAAGRFNLPRAAITALKPGTENGHFEPTHAAPTACVDDDAASTAAAPPIVVPRPLTPQAAEVLSPVAKPVPDGGVGAGTHSDEAPAPPSVGAVADASVSEGPRVAPNNPDEDDLAIPPFLIRAKQERAA